MNAISIALRAYRSDTQDPVQVALAKNISISGFRIDVSEFDANSDAGAIEFAQAIKEFQDRQSLNKVLYAVGGFIGGVAIAVAFAIINTGT